MPRGGRRPGAGRKPKPKLARVLAHPSIPPPADETCPIEEFEAPAGLTPDEHMAWVTQAPFAFRNRTLTRASALAFERYCKVLVLERYAAVSSGVGGVDHRGLLKQVNQYELQFMLIPNGRPMPNPEPDHESNPVSKLARFRS